jgi:hypothetical protein
VACVGGLLVLDRCRVRYLGRPRGLLAPREARVIPGRPPAAQPGMTIAFKAISNLAHDPEKWMPTFG